MAESASWKFGMNASWLGLSGYWSISDETFQSISSGAKRSSRPAKNVGSLALDGRHGAPRLDQLRRRGQEGQGLERRFRVRRAVHDPDRVGMELGRDLAIGPDGQDRDVPIGDGGVAFTRVDAARVPLVDDVHRDPAGLEGVAVGQGLVGRLVAG